MKCTKFIKGIVARDWGEHILKSSFSNYKNAQQKEFTVDIQFYTDLSVREEIIRLGINKNYYNVRFLK